MALAINRKRMESTLLFDPAGNVLAVLTIVNTSTHKARIAIEARPDIRVIRGELLVRGGAANYVCGGCEERLVVCTDGGPEFKCPQCGRFTWRLVEDD